MRTLFIEVNGLRFAVDERGEGDDVALLLHGFPESRAAWDGLGPRLAELGWRVAAPDMRGYGDSDRPAGREDYALDRLVADVEALFAMLEAGGRRGRRILIGHDWGGIVAWAAAMRMGANLDGLVILNAPHPAVFQRVARRSLRQLARSWYILFFQLPGLPEAQLRSRGGRWLKRLLAKASPAIPEDTLEIYARNIVRPAAAKAMINYYRANFFGLGAGASLSTPIRAPTLMLWGEADPHLDLALAREMEGEAARRLVPDLTLKTYPGVSHWIAHEAPDAVLVDIRAWATAMGLAAASVRV